MSHLNGKTLLVFGDSIMYGSGNDGFGVGEYLEKEYGFVLKKYCVGGARTGYCNGKSWIIEQVRLAIENGEKPDYIIFDGFTNDCCQEERGECDVPLGEVEEGFENFDIFSVEKENTNFSNCFQNILAAFKKYFPAAKAVFVRPHKMGRRGEEVQRIYGERAVILCKKWGVAVADVYSNSGLNTFNPDERDKYTFDSYGWGKGDCTHPNGLCYKEKYLPVIKRAFETE
ncbi:MAG: SGNH/GDSL hydrolase family protein [Clostridia bacterium]|nr:SGNH/GDSL hydrolase family protein [Clostridia bacterium]